MGSGDGTIVGTTKVIDNVATPPGGVAGTGKPLSPAVPEIRIALTFDHGFVPQLRICQFLETDAPA